METSRRNLLGAMAVIPALALPAIPLLASGNRTVWNAAVARYNLAWDVLEKHPFNHVLPNHPDHDRLDAEFTPCAHEATQSVDDLMAIPAPDSEAVAEKLSIYIREYGDNSGRGHLASLLADIRRLAGRAVAHG